MARHLNCRLWWGVAVVLSVVLAQALPARAGQVLSLNVTSVPGTGLTPALVAGVPGSVAEVANWNNLIVPSSGVTTYVGSVSGTLNLSDGSSAAGTGVSWNWTGHNGSAANNDLFQSNWDPFGATPDLTLSVTGIPFARYDVIAYVPASGFAAAERGGEIKANGQTRVVRMFKDFVGFPKYVESTATSYSGNPLAVPEGTYVRFTDLSGDLTLTSNALFGDRLRLAGVQIIDPALHVGGQGALGSLQLGATLTGGTLDTPLDGARVVKIIQNKSGTEAHLHFREIEALEGATNWSRAAGATASQSTTFGGLAASRAIDGDLGTINHTETGLGQFVTIDLGAQRTLDTLRIYNRSDCCQARASDIQVQIFGDTAQTQLLFDQRVLGLEVSPYVKDVPLGLLLGAVSVGALDRFADYHMELGNNQTSDQIVVPLLPLGASTELQVAGDLVVTSIASSIRVGDTFHLLVADQITGSFGSITLPQVPGVSGWDVSNLYTLGTITAVPEPSAMVLLGLGAAGLMTCRVRRRRRRG